jgi:exonuclease VII small subunit
LQKVKEHFHCSMTHAKQIISIFENKEVSLNKSFGIKE